VVVVVVAVDRSAEDVAVMKIMQRKAIQVDDVEETNEMAQQEHPRRRKSPLLE
jgi:hypothetical protein